MSRPDNTTAKSPVEAAQSPGGRLLTSPSASSDALGSDDSGMDKKDIGLLKPPRGKSFLTRKSVKRSQSKEQTRSQPNADIQSLGGKGKERENASVTSFDTFDELRPLFPVRSIIPDPLNELPSWFTMDHNMTFTSAAQFAAHARTLYPLYNPIGPRWYKNHHLYPPSLKERPPTVFSPAFPPMSAGADRSQDSKMPGPSRTPSGSPLPTPTSSQTRLHDIRVRARKISQTAHDGVDMLDGSDPNGASWHHESPYDLGTGHDKVVHVSEAPNLPRTRRTSVTTPVSRRKTIAPSPLSQSTSAVHLAVDPSTIQLPRRLSKRRKPFSGIFTTSAETPHGPKHSSEPPTPMDTTTSRSLKRGSTLGVFSSSSPSSVAENKEKRGSVLGRLVKRFSVMRKPDTVAKATAETRSGPNNRRSMDVHALTGKSATPVQKPALQQAGSSNASKKRIPPPSLHEDTAQPSVDRLVHRDDVASFTDSEASTSVRKLTVANPDEPSSSDPNTPVIGTAPLAPAEGPKAEPDTASQLASEEPKGPVVDVPLTNSPAPVDNAVENSPHQYQSRLSTILSAPSDYPGSPPSPPLPELPPSTPGPLSPGIIPSENSLPPTPATTRPPSPTQSVLSSVLPPLPPPSPSVHSQILDGVSKPMSPSVLSALPEIDESPLSRASMVVNPPTPMAPVIVIPRSPSPMPEPPLQQTTPQISEETKISRDHSPTKRGGSQRIKASSSSAKAKHTETFKLVRSPSGNVHTVGEGFIAEGEHWEVVASPVEESRSNKKTRSKSKEEDTIPGSRESKDNRWHEHRSGDDDSDPPKPRDGDRRRKSVSSRHQVDTSGSSHATQASIPNGTAHNTDGRHERRRSSGRRVVRSGSADDAERLERHRSAKDSRRSEAEGAKSTQTPVYPNATQPSSSGSRRERKASATASMRPSSEIQSAGVNSLKAKEAWDIDRLWKGRSMVYGPDGTTLTSNRPTIGTDSRPSTIMSADLRRATSIQSVGDLARTSPIPMANGSSHTYFMVQASPYQGQSNGSARASNGIYPVTPPSPRRDYTKHYRSFADAVPFPSTSPTSDPSVQRSPNPLPEPPRASPYKPSPLPPSIAAAGEGASSSEYWAALAGVPLRSNN